jgi:hypothetical protein
MEGVSRGSLNGKGGWAGTNPLQATSEPMEDSMGRRSRHSGMRGTRPPLTRVRNWQRCSLSLAPCFTPPFLPHSIFVSRCFALGHLRPHAHSDPQLLTPHNNRYICKGRPMRKMSPVQCATHSARTQRGCACAHPASLPVLLVLPLLSARPQQVQVARHWSERQGLQLTRAFKIRNSTWSK